MEFVKATRWIWLPSVYLLISSNQWILTTTGFSFQLRSSLPVASSRNSRKLRSTADGPATSFPWPTSATSPSRHLPQPRGSPNRQGPPCTWLPTAPPSSTAGGGRQGSWLGTRGWRRSYSLQGLPCEASSKPAQPNTQDDMSEVKWPVSLI